jgi:hypothetical protein
MVQCTIKSYPRSSEVTNLSKVRHDLHNATSNWKILQRGKNFQIFSADP